MLILKKILYFILTIISIAAIAVFLYLYFPSRQSPIPFDYGDWENGSVRHILPQFDHEHLLLKVSFEEALEDEPLLVVNDKVIQGRSTGPIGRFWEFYTDGLKQDAVYNLQIKSAEGKEITDSWKIKTYPHPDSTVNDLRILKYTCAGGISESFFGQEVFLDMEYRRALLKRALQENPRIVIANGDHVYWDQKTSDKSLLQRLLKFRRDRMYGRLDLSKSMTGEANFETFTNIVDDQITELYGCHLREKSVYFITDDHDLFENDDAIEEKGIVSFPPEAYMYDAAFTTSRFYYPEYLSNVGVKKRIMPVNKSNYIWDFNVGQIRYGGLAHFTLFDAKRNVKLNKESGLITEESESFINEIVNTEDIIWNFQATSSPFAWTAGKWLEWYPDILDGESLTKDKEKYLWQKGWWDQHQRLLSAFHKRKNPSIILQGDLHMASYGMIHRSGDLDFSSNPIPVITTAPLGSGKMGFPSSFRGVGATVPMDMEVKEIYKPVERNGFTVLDINREQVAFDIYTWRLPETMDDIYDMKPSFSSSIKRR